MEYSLAPIPRQSRGQVVPLCYEVWAILHARGPPREEMMYKIPNLYEFTHNSRI